MSRVDLDFVKKHKIESFPLPLPLQSIKPPDLNMSEKTSKELDFLIEMTKKASDKQKEVIKKYEENVLGEFIKYCKTNKLFYDQKYLEQIRKDIRAFCYQLKIIYNRPRPYQLGFYMNKLIIPQPPKYSFTPSYPSYRTLLAKTLANVLSYNNPKHASDLHTIAKEVELSRLSGGYNYPSDNTVSLKIAALLKKYIKYLEVPKKK